MNPHSPAGTGNNQHEKNGGLAGFEYKYVKKISPRA